AVTDLQAANLRADFDDASAILVSHGHGHGDGLLRPVVPVVDVHVRAADRGLRDPDEHIVGTGLRLGDVLHPDAGPRFLLHQRFHGTPSAWPTAAKASRALSGCSRASAADIWVRMRAWPLGTTG